MKVRFTELKNPPELVGNSYCSEEGACAVVDDLMSLRDDPRQLQRAHVICVYLAQVALIKRKLAKKGLEVPVTSVDAVQGCTKKLIFLCTTRPDAAFSCSARRCLTACSRDTHGLVIYASRAWLTKTDAWRIRGRRSFPCCLADTGPSKLSLMRFFVGSGGCGAVEALPGRYLRRRCAPPRVGRES